MEDSELKQEVAAVSQAEGMIAVQAQQAVARTQGQMAIAKRFPRDEDQAIARIKQSCARRGLAEAAAYEYARGGTTITGPSIRMAEAMAQAWGNLDTSIIELERRSGESTMLAYCTDLETNYSKQVVFSVPHIRDKRGGGTKLTESRDIYEAIMNQGSRRLRNCILAVVPGDITEMAMQECEKTLAKNQEPLDKRIVSMLKAMADIGVTQKMIETRFQCNYKALTERQVSRLRNMYQSLKDGVADVADFFSDEKTDQAGEMAKKFDEPEKRENDVPDFPAGGRPATASPKAGAAPPKEQPAKKEELKPGDFGYVK